jgi:uncharacterized peroxidase-related enzyme
MEMDQDTRPGRTELGNGQATGQPPAGPLAWSGRGVAAWALAGGVLLAAAMGAGGAHSPVAKAGTAAPLQGEAAPLSLTLTGARRPTYILFLCSASSLERQFLASLRPDAPPRDRDDLRVVLLNRLDGPIARRFGIRETPALIALEPGGKEVSRRVGAAPITATLSAVGIDSRAAPAARSAAAGCRIWKGPRLRWIEETDPRARRVYRRFAGGQWGVPDIFKAMSLRPELMEKALDLPEVGHFSDGYLDRRTKERIATYVSALNGSHYCLGSHAGGLRAMGVRSREIEALARGNLETATLSPRERALFEFVQRLTQKPGEMTDQEIARLRAHGWRDEQIFEAAFDASLFAFFNRMASTYGLDYPADGWKPTPRAAHTAPPPAP